MVRRFSVVALTSLLFFQTADAQRLPVVNVGIVMDGDADLRQRARELLEPELVELMGGRIRCEDPGRQAGPG